MPTLVKTSPDFTVALQSEKVRAPDVPVVIQHGNIVTNVTPQHSSEL